jgi:hypothetical protein
MKNFEIKFATYHDKSFGEFTESVNSESDSDCLEHYKSMGFEEEITSESDDVNNPSEIIIMKRQCDNEWKFIVTMEPGHGSIYEYLCKDLYSCLELTNLFNTIFIVSSENRILDFFRMVNKQKK